jgi:hypothetical protein
MEADEKKCPSCAETVKAEAKVCRHCGYNFETGQGPGAADPSPPAKKSSGLVKGGLGCLALVVLIAVVAAIFGGGAKDGSQNSSNSSAPPPQAIKVTAKDLAAAYSDNEAAAQQRYGNGPLEVTGVVDSIQLGLGDHPFIVLKGVNMFQGPQAKLADASEGKASSLSKGQTITLRCASVSEVVGTAMLRDCDLP